MNAAKDERLRAHIMQWHDGEVSLAERRIVGLGVVQLVISTVTVLVMNRTTDVASKKLVRMLRRYSGADELRRTG